MGGCLSSQAGGEAAERGQAGKQQYAKNKVVPEPTSNTNGTAANAAAQATAANGIMGPIDVGLQEVVTLCASISPKTLAASTPALAQAQHKLTQQLQALKPAQALASAAAAAQACSRCIDSIMAPVLTATEKALGGGEDTGSQPQWDSISPHQLLSSIEKAISTAYPDHSQSPAAQVKAVAEMLHQLKHYANSQGSPLAPAATVVHSVGQLATMMCLIFFRRVTVETQAALESKAEAVHKLQSILGWEQQHLAACISADTAAALAAVHQGAKHGQTRLGLTVRRSHGLWDALDQAEQQGLLQRIRSASPGGDRKVVLMFPSFVDEYQSTQPGGQLAVEAGEGHGPRKEFYAAVGASATGQQTQSQQQAPSGPPPSSQQQQSALLTFNRTAGCYWYNSQPQETPTLVAAYQLLGWLMGQALLTRATLNIQLPPLLFQQLLQGPDSFKPDLAALEAFDPSAAAGVRNAAALPDSQFRGMLEMEGLPPGTTREQYTAHAVHQLLVESTGWQAAALAQGWWAAVDRGVLESWGLGASALAAVVGGSSIGAGGGDFTVRDVFRVVMDDDLGEGGDGQVVGEMLWQVVEAWPPDRKCAFLEFVTGSSRLPPPGSELLKVEAPFLALGPGEHSRMLGMLPQAHTCDNLLELPNYWEALLHVRGHAGRGPGVTPFSSLAPSAQDSLRAECRGILEDRLLLAVTGFLGYGLDERDGGGTGTSTAAPGAPGSTLAGQKGKPTGEAAERGGQQYNSPASPLGQYISAVPGTTTGAGKPMQAHASLQIAELAEARDSTVLTLSSSIDQGMPPTPDTSGFTRQGALMHHGSEPQRPAALPHQGSSSKQANSDMWDGITDSMARIPPTISLIFADPGSAGPGGKLGLKATPVTASTGSTGGGVVRYQRDVSSAASYGASTLGSGVEWGTGEGLASGRGADFSRAPSSSVYPYGSASAADDLVELGSIAPGAVSTTASGRGWATAGANSAKSAGPSGLGYLEEGVEEDEGAEGVPASHPNGLPRAGPPATH